MPTYPTYKLGEICDILNGFPFKSSRYVSKGLRVIRITNVKKGFVIDDEPQFYPIETQEELKKYILKKDDLLISLTGNVGRVGILKEELLPAALNQRVGCLRIKNDKIVSLQYLFHLLNMDSFEKDCINSSKGIAQKNMSTEWLKDYGVELPPLATQRAIVTRIESLFAELDKGVEKLKTAQQQLKVYRQAVLNDCLTKGSEKWENVKLGEVAEKIQIGPFGTQLHKSDYIEGGIPLINPMHISDRKIFPDNSFSVSTAKYKELENYYLSTNDVILGRRGEMGRCAVVSENENGMLCGTGSLFIRGGKNLYAKYLCYLLSSQRIIAYFENSSSGTTMSNLNRGIVENTEIPLPSLPTQQRIVQEIETRLSACDVMEKNINESLQQAEALRQSILKKAFSGELV